MKALASTILLCLIPSVMFGEEGGSAYSILGLGDIRYGQNVRQVSMGYTGIALSSFNSINTVSPATWTSIARTRIEAGLLYEGLSSSDGIRSRYLSTGKFSGALLAIPISPARGIVFVGGFTPYSNVSYDIFTNGSQLGIDYTIEHTGTGGLNKGQAGLSYAFSPELSVGASFEYLFGTITSTRTFTPVSSSFAGGTTTETFSTRGSGVTLSTIISGLGGIAEPLRNLSIGVVATSRIAMRSDQQFRYEFQSEADTSEKVGGRLAIPFTYGVGIGYTVGERYIVGADYSAHPWTTGDLNNIRSSELRDSYRVGAGAERLPSKDTFAPWYDKMTYRAGFYYEGTYYRVNGQPINQWAVTAGFGFTLSGENRLNIAFEYGGRGTTSSNLIKDNIFRMFVSLSINELWFIQYDEE